MIARDLHLLEIRNGSWSAMELRAEEAAGRKKNSEHPIKKKKSSRNTVHINSVFP